MCCQIFVSVNVISQKHVTAGKSITVGMLITCYTFQKYYGNILAGKLMQQV
jgi:hypothetical protein